MFTYSAYGQFTNHDEMIQKLKETCDLNYIYKNELNQACFEHDEAHCDSKDLAEITVSDKVLKNGAHEISLNSKYDGYASMFHKFFYKKTESLNEVLAK